MATGPDQVSPRPGGVPKPEGSSSSSRSRRTFERYGALVVAAEDRQEHEEQVEDVEKIDAARSGAVRMSSVRRDRGVMVDHVELLARGPWSVHHIKSD